MADDGKSYLKLIVFVILTLGAFIGALTSAFFGGAGMYFAQGVYEVDVLDDKYKYECTANCGTDTATYNESAPLGSFTNYETYRDDLNANVVDFVNGYTIIFALLTLVFLFLALKETGLFERKSSSKKDMY